MPVQFEVGLADTLAQVLEQHFPRPSHSVNPIRRNPGLPVIAGLGPAIHGVAGAWIPGSSPGMTPEPGNDDGK